MLKIFIWGSEMRITGIVKKVRQSFSSNIQTHIETNRSLENKRFQLMNQLNWRPTRK